MRRVLFAALLAVPIFAHAAPFDPEAASQAYLSTLKGAARAKSDSYFEGGYWLILWGTLVSMLGDFILLHFGLSARIRDWAERITKRRFLQYMLYGVPYLLIGTLIALPWTIYTGYFREKQYDLMNQSFGGWAGEAMIGVGVSLLLMPPIIALVMWGISRSPRGWWLKGTAIAGVIIALFIMISPVFISPLFNEYKELPAGPVRDRIVGMAQSRGVPANHIYIFDQSKQHKRISANVSGLGPTIRISLNDNLLNRADIHEISDVMGHEMGHYVLGHGWKLSIAFALIFGFSFWVASRVVPAIVSRWGSRWGLRGVDDVAALPVYAIVLAVTLLLITPVQNSIIRHHESEADMFGLQVGNEPDGFARIALKLSEYRKIEPGPIEEMLFFDHPSGATRIRMAMAWKATHPAKVAPQK
jgi:STE24 endopeptidase